jgi:exopolyphosphatase/guanosine-5'-triphosphate,3'-diphosphate pyrophosphatase
MRFAAIDIGTNAARLLIGEVSGEDKFAHVRKLSYTRIPLRLGESVFENGLISDKKTSDFLKTIQAFKLIADIFEVTELRACATSAMRSASNGIEVKEMIINETDIDIDIISGDEEANLIFSTFFLMNIDKSIPFIVVDVGGGSTEISVFENGERVASRSFEIGTVRILHDKFDPEIWNDLLGWLSNQVDVRKIEVIYATGGNINKVHKILGAGHMEPIAYEQVESLRNELHDLTLDERILNYQLRPDRADVIVPALDIYLYILKILECKEIIVPKIGLSDGMVYTMHLGHS